MQNDNIEIEKLNNEVEQMWDSGELDDQSQEQLDDLLVFTVYPSFVEDLGLNEKGQKLAIKYLINKLQEKFEEQE